VPDPATVNFTATPSNGPVPLAVQFTAQTNDSGSGVITSWNWDFGDGSSSTLSNLTHNYTRAGDFVISLVCTNDSTNMVVGVGPTNIHVAGPTIPFTADPSNGVAFLTVNFTANPNGNYITNWTWNFGDGLTTNVQNCSHTYTNGSNFTVTLTATSSNGTTLFGIGPSPVQVTMPTVTFTAWPTNTVLNSPVLFTCPSQDSAGNAITAWNWDFGDNVGSYSGWPTNLLHTYIFWTNSHTFSPKLAVTNEQGMTLKATGPKVYAAYPSNWFNATPASGPIPLAVQFSSVNTDSFGVLLTNWNWKFGDGGTGRGQNPSHTYTNIGTFTASFTATNTNGTAVAGVGPKISAGFNQTYLFGAGSTSGGTSSSGYDTNLNAMTNQDGLYPQAGLALSSNRLYGAMSAGGNNGSGTIFAVNTDGSAFANLYEFSACLAPTNINADGAQPAARLLLAGGTLYGAAPTGGNGGGAIFKLQSDGSGFTNLHSFSYGSDEGAEPTGLVLSGNTLYGAATLGGTNTSGTIFSLNTDGTGFTILHPFATQTYDYTVSNSVFPDGSSPLAPLLLVSNVLYGTASKDGIYFGGTVFSLNTDGSGFAVLHNFNTNEGITPKGELVLSGNTLYGTTCAGGSGSNGAIFNINLDGTGFAPIHSFSPVAYDSSQGAYTNADGANPSSGLLLVGSTLYGTTQNGGAGGSGTVFAINTDGTGFTTVYSFSALSYNSDVQANTNLEGANPYGGLVLCDGYLYGTACNGGSAGAGAIFAVTTNVVPAAGPTLNIHLNGQNAIIWWPSSATGWTLQQCADLTKGNWSASGFTISDDGVNKSVSFPPQATGLFFRLAKQF
jgi:uncharacterized repeat protein (TIGR03803 family)